MAHHLLTYGPMLLALLRFDNSPANLFNCPCKAMIDVNTLPGFVDSDYYCESGALREEPIWYTNDTLWDGMQCGGVEGPCCGLPWFHMNLSMSTAATITTRVCMNEDTTNEDLGIEQFELYVQ